MRIIPKGVKIPKNWTFQYIIDEEECILYVYKDNLGREHIYRQWKDD